MMHKKLCAGFIRSLDPSHERGTVFPYRLIIGLSTLVKQGPVSDGPRPL